MSGEGCRGGDTRPAPPGCPSTPAQPPVLCSDHQELDSAPPPPPLPLLTPLPQYYAQAKNSEMLVDCFYALEDFVALGRLMDALNEGSPLLLGVGDKFQSVGLCNEGVAAFLKVSAV